MVKKIEKLLKVAVLTITLSSVSFAQVDEGQNPDGGSTAGGGPVVYQAIAMKAILSSDDFINKLNTPDFDFIKSFSHLSWENGVTQYLVTTGNGCTLNIQADAIDQSGMEYNVTVGELNCP